VGVLGGKLPTGPASSLLRVTVLCKLCALARNRHDMTEFSVAGLTAIINQVLPEPHAGLLAGLMFGTKTALPRDLYEALITSGTLHIVALSGQNLSILSRLISDNLIGLVGKRSASWLTLVLIAWFVWFVGPSPSIVRAAIMGSLTILAVLTGRQYWAILSWALAVGIMLLFNLSWITDISFQLSALATLGIILFGPAGPAQTRSCAEVGTKFSCSAARETCTYHIFMPKIHLPNSSCLGAREAICENFVSSPRFSILTLSAGPTMIKNIKMNLRLTLAAQVFTIPLILFHFHRISLIAPIANLAIGWIIGPLTGLGWITVLAGFLWLPTGYIIAWFDWVALEYVVRTVHFMSAVPFAGIGQ